MMLKKISIIFLFCTLFSCGYEPLYLKKNSLEKPINNFNFVGDKKTNVSIISFLGLIERKDVRKGYELTLRNRKIIEVISKDKSGKASVYRTSIIVNFMLSDEGEIIKKKEFNANFSYNNAKNKFELSQYQKGIELNLINEISEKIFIFLRL